MEEYKDFVRAHPAQVKRMEETARLAAMFLPTSKFGKYAEVCQESTYSVLGLMSLFHDRVIQAHTQGQKSISADQPPLMRLVRLALTLVTHTEVVLEMLAKVFGGEDRHLAVVYLIECCKAAARLLLLGRTKAGDLLIAGGQLQAKKTHPARGGEDEEGQAPGDVEQGGAGSGAAVEIEELDEQGNPKRPENENNPANHTQWTGRRSGKVINLPPGLSMYANAPKGSPAEAKIESAATLKARPHAASSVTCGPEDTPLQIAGELLHILRPVIYVGMLHQQGAKAAKTSWRPLLVSFILEALSMRCSSVAGSGAPVPEHLQNLAASQVFTRAMQKIVHGSAGSQASAAAVDELRRRKSLMALYMMRSPLFERVTLPAVQRVARGFGHLPGIGKSISPMIVETVMYYHRSHFYTSGS